MKNIPWPQIASTIFVFDTAIDVEESLQEALQAILLMGELQGVRPMIAFQPRWGKVNLLELNDDIEETINDLIGSDERGGGDAAEAFIRLGAAACEKAQTQVHEMVIVSDLMIKAAELEQVPSGMRLSFLGIDAGKGCIEHFSQSDAVVRSGGRYMGHLDLLASARAMEIDRVLPESQMRPKNPRM